VGPDARDQQGEGRAEECRRRRAWPWVVILMAGLIIAGGHGGVAGLAMLLLSAASVIMIWRAAWRTISASITELRSRPLRPRPAPRRRATRRGTA